MSYYLKDPQSRVDYALDWSAGYLDGQIIAASVWSVAPQEPGGATIDAASFDLTGTLAIVAGGIAGRTYRLSNRVTLSDGRVDERSITIRVEER